MLTLVRCLKAWDFLYVYILAYCAFALWCSVNGQWEIWSHCVGCIVASYFLVNALSLFPHWCSQELFRRGPWPFQPYSGCATAWNDLLYFCTTNFSTKSSDGQTMAPKDNLRRNGVSQLSFKCFIYLFWNWHPFHKNKMVFAPPHFKRA